MSKEKLKDVFNIVPPPWKKSLAECIALIKAQG
jgi:hypothetical protein